MSAEPEAAMVVDRALNVFERFDPAGLLAVFLYGSVQADRQREDSDVDIAVLDLPDAEISWADQAMIAGELERSIGRPVDLRMLRDCPLSLQAHVLREGLLFWERDGRAVEEYRAAVLDQHERNRPSRERRWDRMLRTFSERESSSHERRLPG
ncbi:MAG: hypothetical protein KDC27_10545 [Acidobacteria bacterium]|nr:hypothetical protein [Acidobacteriota bacterium]